MHFLGSDTTDEVAHSGSGQTMLFATSQKTIRIRDIEIAVLSPGHIAAVWQ
ncbi:hypothetical protein NRB_45720 [Novosphingobium sp. 11B]